MADYINPFLIPDSDSPVDRSFTDLSLDGVSMSELGLLVVNDGDVSKDNLAPQFVNNTTTIPGRNNILLWTTDVTNNTITRTLATERITTRQLNRLKQLLYPGNIRKLVLAERPYCYTYCYLESVPEFNFVPFDDQVTVGGVDYKIHVYRGSCTVTWTMVYSFWYGQPSLTSIQPYIKQPWALESGIPFEKRPEHYYPSADYQKIEDFYNSTDIAKRFYVVNSGSSQAHPCIKIKVGAGKYQLRNGKTNWSDIQFSCAGIHATRIGKPRIFQDIEYVYNALISQKITDDSEFETYKTKILIDLRQNLDSNSAWRDYLCHMVEATYNSTEKGGKYILSTLKKALAEQFKKASFVFVVDSQNRQIKVNMIMQEAINWNDISAPSNVTLESVQNLEGVSDGKYIVMDSNTSIVESLNTSHQTISVTNSTVSIGQVYIQFLNEYL